MSFILPSNNSVTAIPLLLFLPLSLFLMALLLPVSCLPSPGDSCRIYAEGISFCQRPSATHPNLANVDVAGINWRDGKRT